VVLFLVVIYPTMFVGLVFFIDVATITTVEFIKSFLSVFGMVNSGLILPPFSRLELVSMHKFEEAWFLVSLIYLVIARVTMSLLMNEVVFVCLSIVGFVVGDVSAMVIVPFIGVPISVAVFGPLIIKVPPYL